MNESFCNDKCSVLWYEGHTLDPFGSRRLGSELQKVQFELMCM